LLLIPAYEAIAEFSMTLSQKVVLIINVCRSAGKSLRAGKDRFLQFEKYYRRGLARRLMYLFPTPCYFVLRVFGDTSEDDKCRADVCIVAILRDENRFLHEWLAYHRLLGVDHFFLYDDDPDLPVRDFVKAHAEYVTVIDWFGKSTTLPGRSQQTKAYTDSLSRITSGYRWVAFIDVDEFIVLGKHKSLKTFLREFGPFGAVSLHWHLFGHNGYYDDPPGLVTASLTRRMREPGRMTKTISKTEAIAEITSAHFCYLKEGYWRVDANKKPFRDSLYPGKTRVARVNHYHCRSFRTHIKRVQRGDVTYTLSDAPPDHRWRLDEEQCLRYFVEITAKDKNEFVDENMLKYEKAIKKHLTELGSDLST
jgi:hypothetical protein